MSSAYKRVFKHKRYQLVVATILFALVTVSVWLPNHATLQSVFSSSEISVISKVWFFVSLYASLWTSMSLWQTLYLLLVGILFGINVSLIVFYVSRKQQGKKIESYQLTSLGGLISGILGIGCIACGSVIVTAIFGLAGATALYSIMPLHGYEFGLAGLVIILMSIRYIASRIEDPLVCQVD